MSIPSLRHLISGKIHGAYVTDADVNYEGSVTVDRDLLEAAGIAQYEQVHVLSIDSGQRLTTYAISGESGSGSVCVNGAAARLIGKGEKVIIIAYALFPEAQVAAHSPMVVRVDAANRIIPEGDAIPALDWAASIPGL